MNIMRSLTLAAVATTVATPALADYEQNVYINPHVGFMLFDDQRDLSETGTLGIGLEYRFSPHWAAEVIYSDGNADRKYVDGDSSYTSTRLDGTYYFAGQDKNWNPYVSLGAGYAKFGEDSIGYQSKGTDHEEPRVNLGAGFRYNIKDGVSLRADLREFHGVDESTFDTQVSLGLSFAFSRTVSESSPAPVKKAPADADNDGVTDNRDQCPGTPAGASVDSKGCERDSDGDGVADSRDQCPATVSGARVNSQGCELDSDADGVANSKDQCPGTDAGAQVDATGCTGVTETVKTIEINVQFPSNSSVIGDRYDSEIRRVADFLEQNPDATVEIAGHSDSRGEADYNRFLSQRRADSVARRLTGPLGVNPDRVSAVGYGESEPVASNDTAAGRAENRRVEARFQMQR